MRPLIDEMLATFRSQKTLAERAIAQLSDAQLRQPLDANTNSVAVIIKHLSGNMHSRFTDLLTSDGEKSFRDRDGEFVDTFGNRAEIMAAWESGWACVFTCLETLSDADLQKPVTIRGQAGTVAWAILRQIAHFGYHVGQIVQLARVLAGDNWQTLTIARGQSKAFNAAMGFRP